jgi:D-glucosaminate-6-phosphate ammonia-lyase
VTILNQLGVERVVNASGRMTALGVNTLTPDVLEAMSEAGQAYVDIDELQRAAGRAVAGLIGAEDAMLTTGAAAGVALMVAATIAGSDITRVQALPDPLDAPARIVIQAGHQVNFGAQVTQLIRMAGGTPVAVGSVNSVSKGHLQGALDKHTAAFMFVQSHHAVQKGMLSLAECIEICRDDGVPVLVDAAAEEDLNRFVSSGADLVTFSGGKAIGGPTSGIVAGRADLVEACRAQGVGIGRPMKIGKEGIAGLLSALTAYVDRDIAAERSRCSALVDQILTGLDDAVETRRLQDEAGRGIERAGVVLDPQRARDLVAHLAAASPPVYPRGHLLNLGIVAFDPRPLADTDIEHVINTVRSFMSLPEERE